MVCEGLGKKPGTGALPQHVPLRHNVLEYETGAPPVAGHLRRGHI